MRFLLRERPRGVRHRAFNRLSVSWLGTNQSGTLSLSASSSVSSLGRHASRQKEPRYSCRHGDEMRRTMLYEAAQTMRQSLIQHQLHLSGGGARSARADRRGESSGDASERIAAFVWHRPALRRRGRRPFSHGGVDTSGMLGRAAGIANSPRCIRSRDNRMTMLFAALHESVVDAVDGSSTGT